MFLLRRSAVRGLPQASSLLSKRRSITTVTPNILWSGRRVTLAPLLRRFSSDEVQLNESKQPENSATEHSGILSAKNASDAPTPLEKERDDESMQSQPNELGEQEGTATEQSQAAANANIQAPHNPDFFQPPPNTAIYVGNLLFDIRSQDLEATFSKFGQLKSAQISYDPRGLSRGFGWVEFEKIESAEKAVQEMHQALWEGRRMVVTFKRSANAARTAHQPSDSLFIGNIPFEMSDKDFNDLFQGIKGLTDVRVAIDRRTGQPRGFAHADFIDQESAKAALEYLRQQVRYGRRLKLDYSSKRRPSYATGDVARKPPVPLEEQSSSVEA